MMAATAKYRDDNSGALITGGTSTAYTITSNQVFLSKAVMNGAEISFTIHATNGAAPTLNVDGLGADPITLDGTNAVPTGTLIANSVYTATYYASGTAWRLKDFYQLPFTVPIGGLVDFVGSSVPNSNFVFPIGQAISRTTYSALFAITSTTYGTGDGSTTFNVPDLTGRITAMKEASATRLTSTYFGGNSTVLGAVGGAESQTLTASQIPANIPNSAVTGITGGTVAGTTSTGNGGTGNGLTIPVGASTVTATTTVTINPSGGAAHPIVQPTIILNKLLRII